MLQGSRRCQSQVRGEVRDYVKDIYIKRWHREREKERETGRDREKEGEIDTGKSESEGNRVSIKRRVL